MRFAAGCHSHQLHPAAYLPAHLPAKPCIASVLREAMSALEADVVVHCYVIVLNPQHTRCCLLMVYWQLPLFCSQELKESTQQSSQISAGVAICVDVPTARQHLAHTLYLHALPK